MPLVMMIPGLSRCSQCQGKSTLSPHTLHTRCCQKRWKGGEDGQTGSGQPWMHVSLVHNFQLIGHEYVKKEKKISSNFKVIELYILKALSSNGSKYFSFWSPIEENHPYLPFWLMLKLLFFYLLQHPFSLICHSCFPFISLDLPRL